jgi:hypothetical protein
MWHRYRQETGMDPHDKPRSRERLHLDRQIEDYVHDPYHERYKPTEPAVCPICGVVFEHGRLHWKGRPANANEHICPACHRIRDQLPAGYLTLAGEFFEAHRETILQLINNEEQRAKAEHPLERIMDIQTEEGKVFVRTTDLHLAKRLGDAVHSAYQGDLETKYSRDEYLVRVYWSR